MTFFRRKIKHNNFNIFSPFGDFLQLFLYTRNEEKSQGQAYKNHETISYKYIFSFYLKIIGIEVNLLKKNFQQHIYEKYLDSASLNHEFKILNIFNYF